MPATENLKSASVVKVSVKSMREVLNKKMLFCLTMRNIWLRLVNQLTLRHSILLKFNQILFNT